MGAKIPQDEDLERIKPRLHLVRRWKRNRGVHGMTTEDDDGVFDGLPLGMKSRFLRIKRAILEEAGFGGV